MIRFDNVQAVLFDLDGTLADTAPDLAGALNRMRVQRGLPPLPVDALRPVASSGARGMLKTGLDMDPGHTDYESARMEFLDNYERGLAEATRLFDGVDALLSHLEARTMPWGVVTNKATRFTGPVLQGLGLASRAAVVICGDTTPHAKPHPEPLLEACRRLDVAPSGVVYVGDDLRDIEAAKAARMRSVAVAYGYLGTGLGIAAWGADAVIEQAFELTALLN